MGDNKPNFFENVDGTSHGNHLDNHPLKDFINECLSKTYDMTQFNELCQAILSEDKYKQHLGVIGIRKILSIEEGPPIQAVIDANIVPRLINFVTLDNEPHLQLEAAWALTNVASGNSSQTQSLIDKGGIPLFVKLLKNQFPEVAEQAIWAIGNIAGDSAVFRDMILKAGGLDPLVSIIMRTNNKTIIKHGIWALSNLCRGRPLPSFYLVQNAIPCLCKALVQETDGEVVTDAAWAISYLSDGDENRIEMILQTNVVSSLVRHLNSPLLSILIPCLRTLGNIVTGSDEQTNAVIQSGALEELLDLLDHEKKAVRREACWTLSNITAGNADQIHNIISNPEFINKLIKIIKTDSIEVKREASWVLSNATNRGYPSDIETLVNNKILETFIELYKSEDNKTVSIVLEATKNILMCGEKNFSSMGENEFLNKFEMLGGIEQLEELQKHPCEDIYEKSIKIIENFFDLEEPF